MRRSPEFRVGNVSVTPLHGGVIKLTVTVDDTPASALLDRGESLILSAAIAAMARHGGRGKDRFEAALAALLGGDDSGQPAYAG